MSLSAGIVGLPNAGKSTLFNALAARRLAPTAPHLFTTIDPHEAIVGVPDENLEKLSKLVKPEETAAATVTFIDIAGLVKGAHKGEGLGNQFLAKIREVDVIVHVVRGFVDAFVSHPHPSHQVGTLEQIYEDIQIVNIELELANVHKDVIYVVNVSEKDLSDQSAKEFSSSIRVKFAKPGIVLSAKLEEDLTDFEPGERKAYLSELKLTSSALEKLIKTAYEHLDLITFYTIKGEKEVHGWSIKKGTNALEAAAVVRTDFEKNFIKAEVIGVGKLLDVGSPARNATHSVAGGWKEAKDKGEIRLEGRDYVVQDKDVIEFKVGA